MDKTKWEMTLLVLLLLFLFGSSSTTGGKWAQQILLEPSPSTAVKAEDSKGIADAVVESLTQ